MSASLRKWEWISSKPLPNNHVYDYGKESLIDTMATLEQAGIEYVGAGHDLDEAMEARVFRDTGQDRGIRRCVTGREIQNDTTGDGRFAGDPAAMVRRCSNRS